MSTVPAAPTRIGTRADGRPRLRGWSHAAMAPVAVFAAWWLFAHSPPVWSTRLTVAVFGATMVGLYTVSSVYHCAPWSERARFILSRCDGAMIQLFIVGTFTPVAFHTLEGSWRSWSLIVAWAIGIGGAAIAASPLDAPRWVSAAGYIAVGWLTIVPFTRIMGALPWEGTGLIALGGVLYTVGAIVYARRWPDPLPTWFGFHEIFHLFVIAGSTAHYLAIWHYVL